MENSDFASRVLFMAKLLFGVYLTFNGGYSLYSKGPTFAAVTLIVLGVLLLGLAWMDPNRDQLLVSQKTLNERQKKSKDKE